MIKHTKVRRVVFETEGHCDGPKHPGETNFGHPNAAPLTLENGYGSPFDGDTHHFCSISCLKDWVANPKSNDDRDLSGLASLFEPGQEKKKQQKAKKH